MKTLVGILTVVVVMLSITLSFILGVGWGAARTEDMLRQNPIVRPFLPRPMKPGNGNTGSTGSVEIQE